MTKAYFKAQLMRLLDNRLVTIWVIASVLIVAYHQLTTTIPRDSWNMMPTAYQAMIGFDFSSLSSLYYLIFPLVASLIGTFLLADDRSLQGHLFELTKLGQKRYTLVNIGAAFVIGGSALVFPLVFDALLALAREQGVVIDSFNVSNQVINSETAYFGQFLNHPLLFTFGYLSLFFIIAGMTAAITFLIFKLMKRRSLAILIVFIGFLSEWLIGPLIGLAEISPAIFLIPSQGYNAITPWLIALNLLALSGLLAFLFWQVVRTDDV
ncbi:hypothetical protein FEZ34_13385 [Lacticaseibacillus casei]|uniref:hypothetical protein n=1 Tax=Lacticaseibacillus casei TaxID=1582 RepID=UPI00110A020C|nr:hypothetical protein [Lacticaseibacillus casei]TLQ49816.1 hypothetical protein FEZ34_13385 [Lacticaseibacillus casei]